MLARRIEYAAGLVMLAVAAAADVRGAVVLNSGFDQVGSTRLVNDAADADWVISASPDAAFVGVHPLVRVSPLPGDWMADGASSTSRWIVAGRAGDTSLDDAPGLWTFQASFTLPAAGPATVLSGLKYAADNKVLGILVNGTTIFSQGTGFAEEFAGWHVLGDVGAGLFHPGTNVVQFQILNQEGWNSPVGLRVEGLVVPEPAGLGAVGLLATALTARRRRAS